MSDNVLLFSQIINSFNYEEFCKAVYQALCQKTFDLYIQTGYSPPKITKGRKFERVSAIRNGNFIETIITDSLGEWCLTRVKFFKSFDTFPYATIDDNLVFVKNRLENNEHQIIILRPLTS